MGPGEVDNHECKATTSALVCHFCKKEFCIGMHARNVTVHSQWGIKLTNIQKYTTVKER